MFVSIHFECFLNWMLAFNGDLHSFAVGKSRHANLEGD
jgi:hypothetical protein